MAIDDSKKRDLIANVTTLLRQSKLAGNVDLQRMGMAFSLVLDSVGPGQPIELQSLYDWLTNDAKVDERAVVEICVVLKSREKRLGVEFVLPPKLQALSAEVVETILDRFQAGASKSGTYERKEPAKGAAPPGGPSNPGFTPDKKKPAKKVAGADQRMLIILVLTLILGGGWYAYYLGTKEPPLQEAKVTDPAGLPCIKVKTNKIAAFCDIPAELWKTEGEALRSRAEITKSELKRDKGITTLYVVTIPDNKTRLRL